MTESKENKVVLFGDFELDESRRLLLKSKEVVNLNSKAFDLLLVLLKNHGQILTKNELLDKVWEGQFVEENNLTVHISALRKVFGEKKGEHQFIVTIPGKGYKFVADIRLSADEIVTLKFDSNTNHSIVPVALPEEFETDETFVGRTRETAEIKNLLRTKEINLLTLTGAGGTGKTRLAQVVSNELKNEFSDGVFFVELAAVNEAEFVASAIAQTLDVTESAGKSLTESLTDFLRGRRILLVLDNFEHLLNATPLVKELLEKTYLLKILATSRIPLRLQNEREFKLQPLEFPAADSTISLNEITDFSAIKLFCKRAQSVKPTFLLTETNFSTVTEICRRLDGLPLAIELAAARIKLLSPQAILTRLEKSLNLLTGGTKDAPARQRTIRDAIKWSYDLLAEDEKFLFRRLAIFAGGFTVEAGEAVVSGQWSVVSSEDKNPTTDHQSPTTVLDLLSLLIDCNLLVSKEQTDGNVRLRMLEVVREFAFEVLEKLGELDELRRIHSNYFLSLSEKAEKYLLTETGSEWLEKLENEHDNFRAALSWSLKNDAEIAARIAAALRFFWLNHSHLTEGLEWSRAALQATENKTSKARSDLLLSNGVFLRNQGNLEAARKLYEEALKESRETNNLLHIIKANHGLAAITVLQKDFDAAQIFIEESLTISRQLGDEMQTAFSLASLGDLEMSREKFSTARPLIEECLTLSQKLGNEKLLSTTYFNLGTIDYFEKRYEVAKNNFTESLRIAVKMSNTVMISCALEGFAAIAVNSGNAEQSAKFAGAAESLRESIGYKLEPAEEIFRADYLTKTQLALAENAFAEFYEQGKALSSDEAIGLSNSQSLANGNSNYPPDETNEIIIEHHSIERVIIEEEVKLQTDSPQLIFAKQKNSKLWFLLLLAILVAMAIGFGYWFWKHTANSEVKLVRHHADCNRPKTIPKLHKVHKNFRVKTAKSS